MDIYRPVTPGKIAVTHRLLHALGDVFEVDPPDTMGPYCHAVDNPQAAYKVLSTSVGLWEAKDGDLVERVVQIGDLLRVPSKIVVLYRLATWAGATWSCYEWDLVECRCPAGHPELERDNSTILKDPDMVAYLREVGLRGTHNYSLLPQILEQGRAINAMKALGKAL